MAACSALESRRASILFWTICLSIAVSACQIAISILMCFSDESTITMSDEPRIQKILKGSALRRREKLHERRTPRVFWLDRREKDPLPVSRIKHFHLPEAPLPLGRKVEPLGGPCLYCEEEMNPFKEKGPRRYHEQCTPMAEWQTNFYPVCNQVHEIGFFEPSSDASPRGSGWWRKTWKINDPLKVAALKLVHLRRSEFDHHAFFRTRIEAVSMERLTASPHIVSIFGFCALTTIVEMGDGLLEKFIQKNPIDYVARLEMARDLAEGLRDIHSIDYPNSTKPTMAHNDIKWGNLLSVNGHPKWNDFNDAVLMRWNKTRPCAFHMKANDNPYRAPERTERSSMTFDPVVADIYTFGNILIYLLTNEDIWYDPKARDDLETDQIREKHARGELPYIPSDRWNSSDTAVQGLLWATVGSLQTLPSARLTSHELTEALSTTLRWVKQGKNVSQSEVKRLFSKQR